jgi:hypothetical protein
MTSTAMKSFVLTLRSASQPVTGLRAAVTSALVIMSNALRQDPVT